jgi:hypothetical protein
MDISEIEDLSYDDIVHLEQLLGLNKSNEDDQSGPAAEEPREFSLFGSAEGLDAIMPEELRMKKNILMRQACNEIRIMSLKLDEVNYPQCSEAANDVVMCCQKLGWEAGMVITAAVTAGIKMFTEKVEPGWKVSVRRSDVRKPLLYLKDLVTQLNGNPNEVHMLMTKLQEAFDTNNKTKWYIRKVTRLQKIATDPMYQAMKEKASEVGYLFHR